LKPFVDRLFNAEKIRNRIGDLGPLPANREILGETIRVALPAVAETFLVAIVSMVDTYMVSGLEDAAQGLERGYAVAAVGLTNQPRFVFLAVFLALNIAVSALVARRRGEGKMDQAQKILQQAFIITVGLSVLLGAAAIALAGPAMGLMGAQPDTYADAVTYFRILMAGLPFNTAMMVINAAQRGAGKTRISLTTSLVANVVNVCFNYLLIEGNLGFPRLKVAGAAIATVIGLCAACVMAFISVSRKSSVLKLFKGLRLKLDREILKSMLNLSLPTLGEQLVTRAGFLMYFIIIGSLGTTAQTAHFIGMNFITISFSFADGLSAAAIALVGRRLGEKRGDLALVYSSVCQRLGLCCSFLVALIYIPFGRLLYMGFSDNPDVHRFGEQIMLVISVIVFIQITMVIFVSCLRAAGDARYVMVLNLISIGTVRWIMAYLLCYPVGLGLVGAWLGMTIDQTLRLVLSYLRYRKGKWVSIRI
jgi:putative MATE family efflux protein